MRDDILFRGIVEGQGRVISLTAEGSINVLTIDASAFPEPIGSGEEVAVNGVCLTVQDINHGIITFHLWPVTLEKTNLVHLTPGTTVNLERNRFCG